MFSRRNSERERNKEEKAKDGDKSVAICYDFKLIKGACCEMTGAPAYAGFN